MYGVDGIPHVQFNGTETVVGGGTNMYPYYLDVYNQLIYGDSPVHIEFEGYTTGDTGVNLIADIVLTGNIQPGNNVIMFMLTYNYNNEYFCTVKRYYEETFDLTYYGESGQYEHYFELESNWNISNVNGLVLIQNKSGNHQIYQSAITSEFEEPVITIPFMYENGWATVGLPLIVSNSSYQYIFPDAIENTLFSFDGGYNLETELENGEGYWIRFSDMGIANFTGYELEEITISLIDGWNMVSGVSEVTSIYSTLDPYELIVPNTIYTFNNGYNLVDEFEPGHGYWLRSNGYGDITISIYNVNNNLPVIVDKLEKVNVIMFNDYPLYFGGNIPYTVLLSYSLPPIPPPGAFDVRFGDNMRYARDGGTIDLSGINELAISYDIKNNEEWKLIIGNKVYILKERDDIAKIAFNSIEGSINLIRSTIK